MRFVLLLVTTLSLLPGGVADAQEDVAAAREHYRKGTKAYDLGRYSEAAQEYEAAYDAKQDPALLFNIAQAYRLANDYPKAIRFYRSYLRNVPRASSRPDIEQRIDEMQRAIEQQERAAHGPPDGTVPPSSTRPAEPAVAPPAPSPATVSQPVSAPVVDARRGRTQRIVGLSLIGVGVVGLALGGTFVALAKNANDDLTRAKVYDSAIEDRRNTDQTLDAVFFAVGGAAAVAGVVVYLTGRHAEHRVALVPLAAASASAVSR